MVGLQSLKADPCIDDSIIEEEQAPNPPPDPRAYVIHPYETAQVSGCNDFLPPARDVAASVETTTVIPGPPTIEASVVEESELLAIKSQKSLNSYQRKSTIANKTSAGKLFMKSQEASKENLGATAEKANRKISKEKQHLLPGNIALDLKDKDEDDWRSRMHVE